MGRQPRSMPERYETHGAAWTALELIYSGNRTIVITGLRGFVWVEDGISG